MSAIDSLPPLREVIQKHELMAKKALGQNFLFDLNLTSRIARASGKLEGAHVIEIGPGPGGLTRALLSEGASVTAIERDARCLPALAEIQAHYPGRLTVIEGDALEVDLEALANGRPTRICANLPYNIATPLMIGWMTGETWPPFYESFTVMVQKEVAQRLVAKPTSDPYGRLGVMAGWRMDGKICFDVPPQAFVPQPKIMSSVVHMVPRPSPLPCDVKTLERVTAAAFGQRRKMIRQSLKSLGVDVASLIAGAGLLETVRAEEIDIAGFCALARGLSRS